MLNDKDQVAIERTQLSVGESYSNTLVWLRLHNPESRSFACMVKWEGTIVNIATKNM